MITNKAYPIGQPGKKWGAEERAEWLAAQQVQRSYEEHVISKLEALGTDFITEQYGALSYNPQRYPLLIARSSTWQAHRDTFLVTGGVHGYETSGVLGAMRFLETIAPQYSEHLNILVAPCISPWGFETINRWNPHAVDPNRSFSKNGQSQEAQLLMRYVISLDCNFALHVDLHETTDTDNSEFRPALEARDNVKRDIWDIPDGFYLVGDERHPEAEFQSTIINAVASVTHIADADSDGKLIGEDITQRGVINYAAQALGLCMGFTNSKYRTTTEVYPDSPRVDNENCINAQVATLASAANYVLEKK